MDSLLERYRNGRRPEEFRALVERYVDGVYSQCVRELGDRHLAEDVTQAVFVMLAEKAGRLKEGTVLAGWLFTATRYACANARRSEWRRKRHERKAAEMRSQTTPADDPGAWEDVKSILDGALAKLGRKDRDAVVLRYFERLSMTEVGERLGVSEEAARQRVGRAVRKLRRTNARRSSESGTLWKSWSSVKLRRVTEVRANAPFWG